MDDYLRNESSPSEYVPPQLLQYTPRTIADFPPATFHSTSKDDLTYHQIPTHAAPLRDSPPFSRTAILASVLLAVLFILAVSVPIFSVGCSLGLCGKVDRSSAPQSGYIYAVYDFIAPLNTVWTAFAAALLALATSLVMLTFHLRKPHAMPYILDFCARTRLAVARFQLRQAVLLLPTVPLLLLVGFGSSWRAAIAFLIGFTSALLSTFLSTFTTTHTTSRIVSRTLSDAHRVSLRAASIIGIGTHAFSLFGLAVSYLLLRDVRALAGFVLGASLFALYARQTGGTFASAASAAHAGLINGAVPPPDLHLPLNRRQVIHPASIAEGAGTHVASAASTAPDLLAALSAAIVATGIAAASLPFFYASPYAMCVFNHLHLDSICAAFRAPTLKQSLAASLCRRGDLYMEYPILTDGNSNSAFVALPFIVATIGLLATVLTLVFFYVPKSVNLTGGTHESRTAVASAIRKTLRVHISAAALLVIAASAGVCWGMFGSRSGFHSAVSSNLQSFNLPQLTLENVNEVCRPIDTQDGQGRTEIPFLIPATAPYTPNDAFGNAYPPLVQTPQRLFGCIVLGLVVGLLIGAITEFFSVTRDARNDAHHRLSINAHFGAASVLTDAFGTAMYSSTLPLALIVATLAIANKLFGMYGIGLASVGMLSTVGMTVTLDAYGAVAESVDMVVETLGVPDGTRGMSLTLQHVGSATLSMAKGMASAAAVTTAHALITAMTQEAGLVPGSRQLGGSPTGAPTRHVTDIDQINLVDIFVLVATLLGLAAPFFLSFLSLHAPRITGAELIQNARGQFRDYPQMREENRLQHPDYSSCLQTGYRSSVLHAVAPSLVAVMAPLIIGFGFGQRALVGMATGAIGAGFMLALVGSVAGAALRNLTALVSTGGMGTDFTPVQRRGFILADAAMAPMRFCSAQLLNSFIKLIPSLGIVAIQLMQVDITRGWIGLVLLLGTIAAVRALLSFSEKRFRRCLKDLAATKKADAENWRERIAVDRQNISPYYEEQPGIRRDGIHPTSQMGHARAGEPFDPNAAALVMHDLEYESRDSSFPGLEPISLE